MIPRALVRVGGPPGAGKTTFIEVLLSRHVGLPAIAVRCVRDPSLREAEEVQDEADAELSRYQQAGAVAARYTYPVADAEAFFMADFMQEWAEAVLLEGDDPIGFCDLTVHVAAASKRPLLVRRKGRDTAPASGPAVLVDLNRPHSVHRQLLAELRRDASITGPARKTGSRRPATARWRVIPEHAGIERAQVVIVNVRGDLEREHGNALLADVVRMREDSEVFADLRADGITKARITAVVADLSDPTDPGTKKAVAKVRRTIRSLS